jgi:spore coat polysaccharide biosynthesis protein SpsF (cytidylyltransferase family)
MKKVAIIQARMGSSRLPGKMLMKLADRPVVDWVVERARRIAGVDEVWVATTHSAADDDLTAHCRASGVSCFRGSEEDVLDRYHAATAEAKADVIMRLTGDCPLLDPAESGKVLKRFLETPGCDYACNIDPPFLPDGLDTEVMGRAALDRAWSMARAKPDREHVTLYIRNHKEQFRTVSLRSDRDLSRHRWTLDEARDFEMLTAVAEELRHRGQSGSLDEVLAVLHDYPEVAALNHGIQRNEGLERSLTAPR